MQILAGFETIVIGAGGVDNQKTAILQRDIIMGFVTEIMLVGNYTGQIVLICNRVGRQTHFFVTDHRTSH